MAMSQTVFRCLRHVLRVGLVSVTAAQFGCADEGARAGTQAATECARNNLAAQCPNNTIPRVEVDAMAACSGSGSIDLSGTENFNGSAAVQNACVGSSTCKLVCELKTLVSGGLAKFSNRRHHLCSSP